MFYNSQLPHSPKEDPDQEINTDLIFILHRQQFLNPPLVAQTVKNLPAMWETWVRSLGWEGLLEKRMATHSSILAWKIP